PRSPDRRRPLGPHRNRGAGAARAPPGGARRRPEHQPRNQGEPMNLPRMTARGRLRRPLATLAAAATALLIAACSSGSGSAGGPATSAAASGSAASGANAPYTVTFGYISSGGTGLTGPWGYAYSKGLLQQWLKSYGITLKLAQFANGPLLTAAMVGGSVDMVVLRDTPTLIAVSQGLQARLVSQPEL